MTDYVTTEIENGSETEKFLAWTATNTQSGDSLFVHCPPLSEHDIHTNPLHAHTSPPEYEKEVTEFGKGEYVYLVYENIEDDKYRLTRVETASVTEPEFEGEVPNVCPECGKEVPHQRGTPCYEMECPECGASMRRK